MAEVVRLTIEPIQGSPNNYKVDVMGSDFVPNQKVVWRLRGDDPVFDDNIIAPRGGGLVNQDGTFLFTANAISGNLNEDWGKDEIYAEVEYTSLGGSKHKSNNVTRSF